MGNVFDCAANPLDDERLEESAEKTDVVVEPPTPLGRSILWRLQRAFYEMSGPDAWGQAHVPNFVTSNGHIARAYARFLLGVIRDVVMGAGTDKFPDVDLSKPVYLVEVGSGHGRLPFMVIETLRAFEAVIPEVSTASAFPFVLVLTDASLANVRAMSENPQLKHYAEMGILDFARFDALEDNALLLQHGHVALEPETPFENPVIFIANYVLDSLPHEVLRISDGKPHAGMVSIHSPDPGDAPLPEVESSWFDQESAMAAAAENRDEDVQAARARRLEFTPDLITRMRCRWSFEPVEDSESIPALLGAEGDEALAAVVREYLGSPALRAGSTVMLPTGAFRLLRNLHAMTRGRFLLVVADKGYRHVEDMCGEADPHLAIHGSFSMMVNFDALLRYHHASAPGAWSIHAERSEGLGVFLLGAGYSPDAFPRATLAFEAGMTWFTPEDFFVLQRSIHHDTTDPPIRLVLAVLRLAAADSDVLYKFRNVLAARVRSRDASSHVFRVDIMQDLRAVADAVFPLNTDKDVFFEIGRILMDMRVTQEAIEMFEASIKMYGAHYVTYHNLGVCHDSLGDRTTALRHLNEALRLEPTYQPSAARKEAIERALMDEGEDGGADMLSREAAAAAAAAGGGAGMMVPSNVDRESMDFGIGSWGEESGISGNRGDDDDDYDDDDDDDDDGDDEYEYDAGDDGAGVYGAAGSQV